MTSAYVYDAARTPFDRFAGALSGVRPDDLAALVLRALLDRSPRLDPEAVDEVLLGANSRIHLEPRPQPPITAHPPRSRKITADRS